MYGSGQMVRRRREAWLLDSDDCDGDHVHFRRVKEHGRRSLPEGATVEVIAAHQDRGFQARKILAIDLSTALPMPARPVQASGERADRKALADAAGEYEPVEVKWFNRVKGYGFLNRAGEGEESEDIFVHMETVANPKYRPSAGQQGSADRRGQGGDRRRTARP